MRPSSTKAFFLWLVAFAVALTAVPADAAAKKPNIIFIMGDDIGMWNISAYHRGMMAGRTPNIDKLAAEGAIFTDYYAEASCTAGRANFITGELPIRTGLTTVGQAGAKIGIPAQAVTIATALKDMGLAVCSTPLHLRKLIATRVGRFPIIDWHDAGECVPLPMRRPHPRAGSTHLTPVLDNAVDPILIRDRRRPAAAPAIVC